MHAYMYFIYTYICLYVCGFLGTSSPNTIRSYVKINEKFQKSEKIKKDTKTLKCKIRPPYCEQHNLSTEGHEGNYNKKLSIGDL